MVAECLLRHLEGGGCAPRSPRLFFTEKMKISSTFYGDFMGDWVGDFMGFAWDFMVFYGVLWGFRGCYRDFMVFNRDLIGFDGDFMVFYMIYIMVLEGS